MMSAGVHHRVARRGFEMSHGCNPFAQDAHVHVPRPPAAGVDHVILLMGIPPDLGSPQLLEPDALFRT
jgi:hypothetical protein